MTMLLLNQKGSGKAAPCYSPQLTQLNQEMPELPLIEALKTETFQDKPQIHTRREEALGSLMSPREELEESNIASKTMLLGNSNEWASGWRRSR